MPDSMMDRAIVIGLKRKTKTETIARIRETPSKVFDELCSKIVRFVEDNGAQIGQLIAKLPTGLNDRAEDCWLPLFAIADVAGGNWPDLATKLRWHFRPIPMTRIPSSRNFCELPNKISSTNGRITRAGFK
jgi:hypothetical protein